MSLFKLRPTLPARWHWAGHEASCASMIELSSMLTEHDVLTRDGAIVRFLKLRPVPFETTGELDMRGFHEAKCHWIASLSDIQDAEVEVNEHRLQRFGLDLLEPIEGDHYSADLDRDFTQEVLTAQPGLQREHYISIVLRPNSSAARGLFLKDEYTPREILEKQTEWLRVMEELTESALSILAQFRPEVLGDYWRDGMRYSRVKEFLGFLTNGVWEPMRAGSDPLYRTLPSRYVHVRDSLVELRDTNAEDDQPKYAQILDIREYADVEPGCLNLPLYVREQWIETISGRVLERNDAVRVLKRHRSYLVSGEDAASNQVRQLDRAIEEAADGAYCVVEFAYTMAALGRTPAEARRAGSRIKAAIKRSTGIQLTAVKVVPDAAWYSQLPGNMNLRPRIAYLSSRAMMAMAATHGFPTGKRSGNPWGSAAVLLPTPSGEPFAVNLHESPAEEVNTGEKLPGTTGIYGRTGFGKTTIELFLVLLRRRWNPRPRVLILDKDRSTEIAVRAERGQYLQLRANTPTGVQPFQFPLQGRPTDEQVAAWIELVKAMVYHPKLEFQPSELSNIEKAVKAMAELPSELRWVSAVLDLLDQGGPQTEGNNIHDRLKRWCRAGALGWVFDSARSVLPPPEDVDLAAMDYTQILALPEARGPMLLALLQYFSDVISQGHRLMAVIVELWRALQDEGIAAFILDQIKTIRKKGGLLIYDTQETKDVTRSWVGPSIISQTSTLILVPDSKAVHEDYVGKLGLTEAQFAAYQKMSLSGQRQIMVIQNGQSVICNFDLKPIRHHVDVLSSSPETVRLLDQIRAEVGDDPIDWLPVFRARVARSQTSPLRQAA
nr:VirB4 family type IV secretion/conjugal transfer ATPase [Azohydromonas australica]